MVADLHTLHLLLGVLGLDGRHVPAGPAFVASVTEVEFTPGAGVTAILVGGELVTLGSTPATLRVIVEGNVARGTGLDGQGQSRVAVPAVQTSIGSDLVPEDDGPVVSLTAVNADDVLVLAGVRGVDFDDVATPRAADIAGVVDGVGGALADCGLAKAGTRVIAGREGVGPARAGSTSSGCAGRAGSRRNRRDGSNDGGGHGDSSGSFDRHLSSGSLRDGGSGDTGPLVDPGDLLTVDSSDDDIADVTLVVVVVTAFMAVQASSSGASRQSGQQEHGVLELHDVGLMNNKLNGYHRCCIGTKQPVSGYTIDERE